MSTLYRNAHKKWVKGESVVDRPVEMRSIPYKVDSGTSIALLIAQMSASARIANDAIVKAMGESNNV